MADIKTLIDFEDKIMSGDLDFGINKDKYMEGALVMQVAAMPVKTALLRLSKCILEETEKVESLNHEDNAKEDYQQVYLSILSHTDSVISVDYEIAKAPITLALIRRISQNLNPYGVKLKRLYQGKLTEIDEADYIGTIHFREPSNLEYYI